MQNQLRLTRHRTSQLGARRRIAAGLATVGICTLVAATAATPAAAFPGFTLTTGGGVATTAQIPYQATATSNLIINDITAPTFTWNCVAANGSNASTLGGNVFRGTSRPNLMGTVTASKFGTGTWNGSTVVAGANPCLGASQRFAFQQIGTWALSVAGPTSNGVTPLTVHSIKLRVYVGTCSYDLAGATATTGGSVSGTYTNRGTSGSLSISASGPTTLVAYNTSVSTGCLAGFLRNGDRYTLSGTYSVAVAPNQSALDPISLNA